MELIDKFKLARKVTLKLVGDIDTVEWKRLYDIMNKDNDESEFGISPNTPNKIME